VSRLDPPHAVPGRLQPRHLVCRPVPARD
jgi:hypothetical protein